MESSHLETESSSFSLASFGKSTRVLPHASIRFLLFRTDRSVYNASPLNLLHRDVQRFDVNGQR